MKVKTITWCVRSRLLEVSYEDGVKGSMVVSPDYGEFRGVKEDSTGTFHDILWTEMQPHPYTIYNSIRTNADSLSSLNLAGSR